ncbi:MAG: SUMF1/EgtB/PvdO family nonheme iron enzyme [Opitutales bacterium]
MNRIFLISIFLTILPFLLQASGAPSIPAHLPPNLDNDESALLATARAVEPELLKNGYRKYELVSARVAAWTKDQQVEPKDLKANLFLPAEEDHKGPYPLLVYVHGGGFMGGSPDLNVHSDRSFSNAFRYMLDHGVAVASVGYRLAREGGWPAPVSDPLCSMRFLQQNGAHWNLMTDRLALVGHSAGARSVGLIGMVPQDDFHTQGLPWKGKPVSIAGTFLWAGSINTKPLLDSFGEFGKPRWYSVPRLHHGEHPAWDVDTRHSIRIRNNSPHFSNQMPPLHMVRGRSDYGGDHSDATQAVELWQKLGIDAELDIVEGGHNTAGPPEKLLQFVKTHLVESPFEAPELDIDKTVRVLLELNDPLAALEVLSAAQTTEGGTQPPPGDWLFSMHEGSMAWIPDSADWPDEHRSLASQAKEQAAILEADAAKQYFERSDWFRAGEAARNVRQLSGESDLADTIAEIEERVAEEADLFKTWHRANQLWLSGEQAEASELIERHNTPRLTRALAAAKAGEFPPPVPGWADQHGTDLYGPWAAIELKDDVAIRLRWVAPGSWDLPEYLHYQPRGRAKDEPITRIEVEAGFWIAETETTRAQWKALLNDKAIAAEELSADPPRTRKDYLQIVDWLKKLSEQKESLLARLPTEAEWLHAATGGGRSDLRGGTDLHAVHALNVNPEDPASSPVDSVVPDAMGLYGMIGGVLEWTASGNHREARFNDENGRFRIFRYPMSRGGAWSSFPHVLGVGTREWHRHANRQPDLGFRLIIGGEATADNWLNDVVKH